MPGFLAAVLVQLLSVRQEILSDRKNILSTMLTDFPVWMLWTYFHLVWVSSPTAHTRSVNIYKRD